MNQCKAPGLHNGATDDPKGYGIRQNDGWTLKAKTLHLPSHLSMFTFVYFHTFPYVVQKKGS